MTDITALLGTRYPIIQGAMAQISNASLVSAVSEGGGLGVIAGANLNGDQLRREIRLTRERTDKPFAVNLPMLSPYVEECAAVVTEEKPHFVVTAAGNPSRFIPRWKEAGIRIISVVATPKQAKKMEELGADLIVAEGHESGGHVGLLTTMALIPQVVEVVKVPVVAAGGIATGAGMAAALQLGASGVQLGTLFLAATENDFHPGYQQAVLAAGPEDAIVTGARANHAVRCLRNTLTGAFAQLDREALDVEAYERLGAGSLYKAVREGDADNGSVMAGQIAGLVREAKPAARLIADLVADYNAVINRLPTL